MFELMYASGMRISECLNLNLEDLHLSMGFVRVYGKGGKERIIPLGGAAYVLVELFRRSYDRSY